MAELIFKDEVYSIVGAMFEVYKTLGTGYLEAVYQEALAVEFGQRGIPFEREHQLSIFYKDVKLQKKYCPDFVCFGQIILELKVLPKMTKIEIAQLINYLKITKMKLGLLANFGSSPQLEWNRYVL
ncbi:MAG: GxxExxY protein [Acidobacteria bacterium]|nr:GxxExxY protein [Acidobacteriota bacterium]